jgi:predicted RNA binding protein YcfA (HicA-like mRNA interferase family)
MTERELRKLLRLFDCVEIRQKSSHLIVRCGKCQATVPVHKGEDIDVGTLRAIGRQLEPCLGKGWWLQ